MILKTTLHSIRQTLIKVTVTHQKTSLTSRNFVRHNKNDKCQLTNVIRNHNNNNNVEMRIGFSTDRMSSLYRATLEI